MALRVVTAASTSKLISLHDVKQRLGIEGNQSDDLLSELIEDASSAVAEYLGRASLSRQQYEEKLSGNDRLRIHLSQIPVDPDSVTLTIDGTADTDFSVESKQAGTLFREGTWSHGDAADWVGQASEENLVVTYKGGWVLPDQISTWAKSKSYAAGAWVRPSSPALSPLLYECTTAGTSGSSEPAWGTTAGGTTTDNSVTWTARDAAELPRVLRSCAFLAVQDLWTATTRGGDVQEIEADGMRERYFERRRGAAGLPEGVQRSLDAWRHSA